MAKEICQDCGKVFEGGFNAFFCVDCRKRRLGESAKRRSLDKIGNDARSGTGRNGGSMNNPCDGRIYFFGGSDSSKCCNYIFIRGKSIPCLPGTGCTVRVDRKRRGKGANKLYEQS